MLRKSAGILLLSNINIRIKKFEFQFFHTSYQAYKKTAQPNVDKVTVTVIDPIKIQILSQLHKRFQCSIDEAYKLYDILNFPKQNLDDIALKKGWLTKKGASTLVMRANCEILLHTSENLQNRFDALNSIHWKKTDDFLPLLMLDEEVIFKVRSCESWKCFVHRIYELSEKLSMEPHIISRACVKHPFIFDMREKLFKTKLEIILNQPIAAEAILRDLDIFRRGAKLLQKRFEFLAKSNIGRILPWMVKTSDEVIERMIAIRSNQSERENETLEHLAEWLDLNGNTARKLLSKHKALACLNVNELRRRMEFLLEFIEPIHLRENIYLLLYPIDKLIDHADELKSLGKNDISPSILRKRFQK